MMGSVSPLAKASNMVFGTIPIRKSTRTALLSVPDVGSHGGRVQPGRIGVESRARPHHVRDDCADQQSQRRNYFKIDQGFAAHPADSFQIAHAA